MLSANHLTPDLAAEIYVLDRAPDLSQEARSSSTETQFSVIGDLARASG
jgi:hypothetical protein